MAIFDWLLQAIPYTEHAADATVWVGLGTAIVGFLGGSTAAVIQMKRPLVAGISEIAEKVESQDKKIDHLTHKQETADARQERSENRIDDHLGRIYKKLDNTTGRVSKLEGRVGD